MFIIFIYLFSLQAFGGFLLLVTSDGTILFVSTNILVLLGFNQVGGTM